MSKRALLWTVAGGMIAAAPLTAGLAQAGWVPGSEIAGQAVQVETNGVMNTVYFEPGGVARIQTPGGNVVPAAWTAQNQQLCLNAAGATECWPYAQPFQAGQQITLTSTCQVASRWLPISTAPPPPPMQMPSGERG